MSTRFQAALSQLPSALQPLMHEILAEPHFSAQITPENVRRLCAASNKDEYQLALALLPAAAACAVTPLSHFNVGAIAHGASGTLYFGANLEFPSVAISQTVHAEQSAISHAWLSGEPRLQAVTVNYTPCGHCRQFMTELNSGLALNIQLPNRPIAPLGTYLPDAFSPQDLNISQLLMDPQHHGYPEQGDALNIAAINAANRSHAPYSEAYAGVALLMDDGNIFSGSYAENAAYNPSFPPLQGALNLLYLNGYSHTGIVRAVYAEREAPRVSHFAPTRLLLETLGCTALERQRLVEYGV